MKILAAALVAAAGTLVVSTAAVPVANADVCGDVGGRHVSVGGCTDIAGNIATGVELANGDDAAAQAASGLPPCYTVEGVPYYTPAGQPC